MTQPRTIYIVIRMDASSTQILWSGVSDIFAARNLLGTDEVIVANNSFSNFGQSAQTLSNGTFYLVTVVVNGASSSIAINGNAATTFTLGSGTMGSALDIGAYISGMGYGAVTIKAVGIYSSQTSGDIAATKGAFNSDYAIYAP